MSAVAREFFSRSTENASGASPLVPVEPRAARDARAPEDAPIVLDAPGKAVNRVRRVDLLRAAIDRPNLAGSVGLSLAWRRENLPPRPLSALGSLTTFRLALKVNLRTQSRRIRHNRSFIFALGREDARRASVAREAFDDVERALEPPTGRVTAADPVVDPVVGVAATPAAVVAEPDDERGAGASTPPAAQAAPSTSELDELMLAMELTQRSRPAPRSAPPEQAAPVTEGDTMSTKPDVATVAERPLPPAGWYPDPMGGAQLRFWDRGWTIHVKTDEQLSTSPLPGMSR